MPHIRLTDVSLQYPIFTAHTRSLKKAIFTRLGGEIDAVHNTIIVRALDNVSLDLREGDRLGVVGHNGSGKTTLLRVISRIYQPQSGNVDISGTLSCFTDLTLGMDAEANGWDNIIFRCIFMGMTFSQARKLAPSIGEFTELGEYLNMPVRTYSSGMFVRLAFAISTAVQPDIIVMDEMIGAGDARFIKKAEMRLKELLGRTKILVIASHQADIIRNFCNKALWLEHGRVKDLGTPSTVLGRYLEQEQVITTRW